jgi:hypothetical protein
MEQMENWKKPRLGWASPVDSTFNSFIWAIESQIWPDVFAPEPKYAQKFGPGPKFGVERRALLCVWQARNWQFCADNTLHFFQFSQSNALRSEQTHLYHGPEESTFPRECIGSRFRFRSRTLFCIGLHLKHRDQ